MSNSPAKRASGLRPPSDPPKGADAFDVALFFVKHWEDEFARTRLVVKGRAKAVVVSVSIATASIAIVGAATPVTGWTGLGIVSAALAGLVTVINAWDGLFRHRELWLQRSLVLGNLQALRRTMQMRVVAGEDRTALARESMETLNSIIADDLTSWSEIRTRGRDAPSATRVPLVRSTEGNDV